MMMITTTNEERHNLFSNCFLVVSKRILILIEFVAQTPLCWNCCYQRNTHTHTHTHTLEQWCTNSGPWAKSGSRRVAKWPAKSYRKL